MNSTQLIGGGARYSSLVLGALGLALTGCAHRPIIVQTPAPTVIQQAPAPAPAPAPAAAEPAAPPPVIVVNQAPPAPLQETTPPQPAPDYVWIPGYWAWRNNQQQWVAGQWQIPPRPGATWVPARWEQRGTEYVFIDGYWQ